MQCNYCNNNLFEITRHRRHVRIKCPDCGAVWRTVLHTGDINLESPSVEATK